MGFFDAFRDPAEFEQIRAQEGLARAEAAGDARAIRDAADRLSAAKAAAAERQQQDEQQRPAADAEGKLTVTLAGCVNGVGVGLDENNCVDMLTPGKPAEAVMKMGDRVLLWNGIEMVDSSGARRLLKDVVVRAEAHTLVIERKQSSLDTRRDEALLSQMYGISQAGAPPPQDRVIRSIADLERRARQAAPVQLAEERLDKAVADAANARDQRAAARQLQQEVQLAREANVARGAPMMAKATKLLALMESATRREPPAKADPLDAKMDAIFGGGYAMPGLEDLDELNS